MRIVVLDGHTLNPGDLTWDDLRELGDLTVYERTPAAMAARRVAGAQAVFTNKTPLTREIIAGAPNLRFIGVLATGYNVVDVEAARERGVCVCNAPAYSTRAVAQHVFALLLEITQHAALHNQAVQAGRWQEAGDFCFWERPLIELSGKALGVVGYGQIGRAVAGVGRALGMHVLPCSARGRAPECVPLSRVLEESDVITLHCPLTEETRGLIRAGSLARMKDGVILINTARGPLIVEEDLRAALISGKVYAAALDVVSEEPIRPDNPLLGLENCLITPHIAWAPKEARRRLMDISVGNLRAFLAGRPQNDVTRG